MEDKRKLIAAVMGAISAYIEMEQPPPPVIPRVKPQPKVSRWKIFRRQGLKKDRKDNRDGTESA